MARQHRITVYDLLPQASHRLPLDHLAFVFAQSGDAMAGSRRLVEGAGDFVQPGEAVSTAGCAWLFDVAPGNEAVRLDAGLSPVLSRIVILPEEDFVVRADRVESEAGARTPAHRHQGPGIRRLQQGLLLADVGANLDRIGPGQAWFESGMEAVIGTNVSGGRNAFVRVMLLPASLRGGQSSFIAMTPEEAAKPRAANIRLLGEQVMA